MSSPLARPRAPALLAAAAAVLLCMAPGVSAADSKVLPGYWESTSQYTMLLSQTKTTRNCVSSGQVEEWITSPKIKHFVCTYTDKRVGDGAASLKVNCIDKHGNLLKFGLSGAYGPEHLHMVATGTWTLKGIPLPASAEINAHRLSAQCPADAQTGK